MSYIRTLVLVLMLGLRGMRVVSVARALMFAEIFPSVCVAGDGAAGRRVVLRVSVLSGATIAANILVFASQMLIEL